ncbi:MAG: hypothetical protein ACRDZ9_01670 [Acidimicrobiales bacterium]
MMVGTVAAMLGMVCVAAGVAISAVETFRPSAAAGAFPTVEDLTRLGKVGAEVLKQFGTLLALFGTGIWLLASRPF